MDEIYDAEPVEEPQRRSSQIPVLVASLVVFVIMAALFVGVMLWLQTVASSVSAVP